MTTGTAATQLMLALVAAALGTSNIARAGDLPQLLQDSPWQPLALPLSLYVGLPPLRLLLALWAPASTIRRAACSHAMQICMHATAGLALLTLPIVATLV